MLENLPHVCVCGVFDTKIKLPGKTETENRISKNYELEFYLSDGGSLFIDGKEYEIKKGMALLAKPGEVRRSILPFHCRFLHFDFSDETLKKKIAFFPSVIYPEDETLHDEIKMINELYLKYSDSAEIEIASQILHLLTFFERERHNEIKKKRSEPTKLAKKFMDENFAEDISLSEVAEKVHLSPIYFHTLFKKEMGVTPMQYLLTKRINAASVLLRNSDLSVAEISMNCGFASQSYFSYCFKKAKSMTPGQYRKETEYPSV